MSLDLWGYDRTAAVVPGSTIFRGINLSDLPGDLGSRVHHAIDHGTADPHLHDDLLNHVGDNHGGFSGWWTDDPDNAKHYAAGGEQDDNPLRAVLATDWNGEGQDYDYTDDEVGEDDVPLRDDPPRPHTVLVNRPGSGWVNISHHPHTASRTAAVPDMYHWDLDWSQAEQRSIPTAGLRWRQYPDYGKPTGRFNFKKMPPVKVLIHEGEPWIMDGHHRVDWAQQRGYEEVPALVMEHPSRTAARLAMPAPLPEGITFRHRKDFQVDPYTQAPAVEAFLDDQRIGFLAWGTQPDHHGAVYPFKVRVEEPHRRHGIATALWDAAQQFEPHLQHSPELSPDGKKWVNYEQSRNARLGGANGDLPENLHFREHRGWTHAYDGEHLIGYLRPAQGKIDMIKVAPEYRRQGVGTAMLDWHRNNVDPDLGHSTDQTPLGRAWGRSVGWNPPVWNRQDPDIDTLEDYEVERGPHTAARLAALPDGLHIQPEDDDWVAYHQGTPVGSLSVDYSTEVPSIDSIRVHPDYRRHGIGKALWEAAGRPAHTPDDMSADGQAWARAVGGPRLAMPTYYHHTDDPDFQLDPGFVPENFAEDDEDYSTCPHCAADIDEDDPANWQDDNCPECGGSLSRSKPGVFVSDDPDRWASPYGEKRDYVADLDGPDLHNLPGVERVKDSGDNAYFVPADQFHHLTVQNVRPRKAKYMTAAVTVYTKPDCPQCTMTKKQLDRLGIEHRVIDVTVDPDAHAYVTGLGYQQAPVVVVGDGEQHWGGFSPDKLKGLVE